MTAPRYNPPTQVTTLNVPYAALVNRADPDYQRRKRREVEYEFSGRVFYADPNVRGAFNQNEN